MAKRHTTLEPLLILKMNREQPIAVHTPLKQKTDKTTNKSTMRLNKL